VTILRDAQDQTETGPLVLGRPTAVCNNFRLAVEVAGPALEAGAGALDAIEKGIRAVEGDPRADTVGLGGRPNREGIMELDAAIMYGPTSECGAVAALQNIEHPISVARKVMEETPHVMLAGQGAQDFALSMGFEKESLLPDEVGTLPGGEKERRERQGGPDAGVGEGDDRAHDTLGVIVLDRSGDLSCGVSTSGAALKLPGRVGDSPLIGAGSYVDNEVGGAVATGLGEHVIRFVGCYTVVENMRRGMSPEEACRDVVERMQAGIDDANVVFTALSKDGRYANVGTWNSRSYAHSEGETFVMPHVEISSRH